MVSLYNNSSKKETNIKNEDGNKLHVKVRMVGRKEYEISINLSDLIEEFKKNIFEYTKVSESEQRLVFQGNVLEDGKIINEIGLYDGCIIYLSRKAPSESNNECKTQDVDIQSIRANNDQIGIQSLIKQPEIKSILSNPDIIKNIFMSNPNLSNLMKKNPQIERMLNDPYLLEEMTNMMSNSKYQDELMRSYDRTLSNFESNFEGHNAVRKLYTTVQEPILQALDESSHLKLKTNPIQEHKTDIVDSPIPNPWKSSAFDTNQKHSLKLDSLNSLEKHSFPFLFNIPKNKEHYPNYEKSFSFANDPIFFNTLEKLQITKKSPSNQNLDTKKNPKKTISIEDLNLIQAKYPSQFKELIDMGFTDEPTCASLLDFNNGDVDATVEALVFGEHQTTLQTNKPQSCPSDESSQKKQTNNNNSQTKNSDHFND